MTPSELSEERRYREKERIAINVGAREPTSNEISQAEREVEEDLAKLQNAPCPLGGVADSDA